jgi:hypothetical protein
MFAIRLTASLILGALISVIADPFLSALGLSKFLETVMGDLLQNIAVGAIGFVLVLIFSHAKRVEKFIDRHLIWLAITLGLCVATSITLNSGKFAALLFCANTAAVALFILFCGQLISRGMYDVTERQEEERRETRAQEVVDLQQQSIAEGAPDAAAAIIGLDAVGGAFGSIFRILFIITGTIAFALLFATVAIANVRIVYALDWTEAIAFGLLFGTAAIGTIVLAILTGGKLGAQVPYSDKHKPLYR